MTVLDEISQIGTFDDLTELLGAYVESEEGENVDMFEQLFQFGKFLQLLIYWLVQKCTGPSQRENLGSELAPTKTWCSSFCWRSVINMLC